MDLDGDNQKTSKNNDDAASSNTVKKSTSGTHDDAVENKWPPWLKPLLEKKFFVNGHKKICNYYCLNCMDGPIRNPLSLAADHKDHHYIQIRRDVDDHMICASDIQNLVDISSVQTYTSGRYIVVYLHKRPGKARVKGGAESTCKVCEYKLKELLMRFCSLDCMVKGQNRESNDPAVLEGSGGKLSSDDPIGKIDVNITDVETTKAKGIKRSRSIEKISDIESAKKTSTIKETISVNNPIANSDNPNKPTDQDSDARKKEPCFDLNAKPPSEDEDGLEHKF